MKWHEVVVHKNIFRDSAKQEAMQHCHIAQWHDGLKRSGKAGMPYRTTRSEEQRSSTPCFLLDSDLRWTKRGHLVVPNPIILHDNAAVAILLRRWE